MHGCKFSRTDDGEMKCGQCIKFEKEKGEYRMRRLMVAFLFICALVCMTGCTIFNKQNGIGSDNTGTTEKDERTDDLETLTADNLFCLNIDSYSEEDSEEDIRIVIYFDEGTICSGKAKEFWDDDTMPEVKSLTEEQIKELKQYVIEYSYKVQEKKDDYWPHYDEYPEMAVLFRYDLWYGEEKYREDGALCYPDGWDEFIETLMSY